MLIIIYAIMIISIALFRIMPSTYNKLISISASLAVVLSAIVIIFFTKTEGQTFIAEHFRKVKN
jgi:hypothetical protein